MSRRRPTIVVRTAFDHAQQLLRKGKRHYLVSADLLQGMVDEMEQVARDLVRVLGPAQDRDGQTADDQEPIAADEWERAARQEALAQAARPDMAGLARFDPVLAKKGRGQIEVKIRGYADLIVDGPPWGIPVTPSDGEDEDR